MNNNDIRLNNIIKNTADIHGVDITAVVIGFLLGINYFYEEDDDSHMYVLNDIKTSIQKQAEAGFLGSYSGVKRAP